MPFFILNFLRFLRSAIFLSLMNLVRVTNYSFLIFLPDGSWMIEMAQPPDHLSAEI